MHIPALRGPPNCGRNPSGPVIILSSAEELNPTGCCHTYIPGFGWDRAPCSLVRREMKTGGQLGRRDEAGQEQKPGQKSRHGVLLCRPGGCTGERALRVETGMGNVT